MESDWEIEIGPEAPVIEALWPGFIDLRRAPERIKEIEEALRFPALAEALISLNRRESSPDSGIGSDAASNSRVWTAKCDLWALGPSLDPWDPDEMDAAPTESVAALACYIDLLGRDPSVFARLGEAERWARATVFRLRQTVCRCCRADLIIRRAFMGDQEILGITVYTTACGADTVAAEGALSKALIALVGAISTARSNTA
jgi:hypothetical protein